MYVLFRGFYDGVLPFNSESQTLAPSPFELLRDCIAAVLSPLRAASESKAGQMGRCSELGRVEGGSTVRLPYWQLVADNPLSPAQGAACALVELHCALVDWVIEGYFPSDLGNRGVLGRACSLCSLRFWPLRGVVVCSLSFAIRAALNPHVT